MDKMKIGIIGGSGFVGTRLMEALASDDRVSVLNIDKNPSARFAECTTLADVRDTEALQRALQGVDTVILLAAEHRDDVTPTSLYYDVNVQGMRNILAAMSANRIHNLVFTSSVAVYGLDKNNADESFTPAPFNHYGKSKWEAEQVLQDWYRTHPDWTVTVVRPTVIFGEGNRGNVFNLLHQIASGRFMMIGSGDNRKSMAYVGNIVAFLRHLCFSHKTAGYQLYNYVDKPDFSTADLVSYTLRALGRRSRTLRIPYWLGLAGGYAFDAIAFLSGKKLAISSVRVKKFCASTQYRADRIPGTGFLPPYSLEDGLRKTLHAEFDIPQEESRSTDNRKTPL